MEPVRSTLLSLVFTDLVDSTALKTRLGDHEAAALIARHGERVRRLQHELGGREVDAAGDGFFLTFRTPSAAVTFALRLQQIHRAEPDLPAVRVGVHLGEVSEREAPTGSSKPTLVEGLAVDLAARIQSLARPGQVLMSVPVLEGARQRLKGQELERELTWRRYGAYELKGIEEIVEIGEAGFEGLSPLEAPLDSEKARRVRGPASRRRIAVAAALLLLSLAAILGWRVLTGSPPPTAAQQPAIAVLPFDNLSGDPGRSIFAAGLAEDLTTRLASWRSFPVIARKSAFDPDLPDDVRQVGRALGARYVVKGSVQEAADRLRIAVRVVDASTGVHVWAQRYDRDPSDVLRLQDEINEAIVGTLNPALLEHESARAMHENPDNLDAWSTAMRGWWHFNRETRPDLVRARELFARAIELDPRWGWPYAGLALAHLREAANGWSASPADSVAALIQNAEEAVALDPGDPFAHHALGHAYSLRGQADRALDAFALGVELNPHDAMANNCFGHELAKAGRSEEAIERLGHAMSISPRDPWQHMFRSGMAAAHFAAGEYGQALEWANKSIQRQPNALAYQIAAASAAHLGRADDARASLQELLRLRPGFSSAAVERRLRAANPQYRARMLDGLHKAGLEA